MTDNIDLLAGKIAELADKLAAPAGQAALEAARMEAWAALSGGSIAICVAAVSIWGARKLWPLGTDHDYEAEFAFRLISVLLAIVAGIAGLIGLWAFADPRTWSTIAHPELWIAKRLLGL